MQIKIVRKHFFFTRQTVQDFYNAGRTVRESILLSTCDRSRPKTGALLQVNVINSKVLKAHILLHSKEFTCGYMCKNTAIYMYRILLGTIFIKVTPKVSIKSK